VSSPFWYGPAAEGDWIEGAGGTPIRTWTWAIDDPRGRVQITHGLSEHLGRYAELAGALNEAGWSVFGHDHRGHGESEGRRGVLEDFDDLLTDLERVRDRAADLAPGPGDPVLLGHSMGGLVALRYLQTAAAPPDRAVVSAPWLATRVALPLWQRLAAWGLRSIAPTLVLQRGVDASGLTRDPDRAARYIADPAVHRSGSPGMLAEVEDAQRAALAGGIPAGTRVLLLLPLADEVVDPEVTARWAAGVEETRMRVRTYPEGRHEPFHDIERATVMRELVEWLNEEAVDSVSAAVDAE
jgi:alpha-beta hydrolase superfamily lysophospholipase